MFLRLIIFFCAIATVAPAQDATGRFTAIPNGSGVGIWILDTSTGEAIFCWPIGSAGGYEGKCAKVEQ